MDYLSWAGQGIRSAVHAYNSINPATLSGAIDIIVCEKTDGELNSTPFHIRFGKLGVLSPKQKVVNISVNGSTVKDLTMRLGEQGEAFFIKHPDFAATLDSSSPNLVSPLSTEYESPASPQPLEMMNNPLSNYNRRKRLSSIRKRDARYMREKFESEEDQLDIEFDPSFQSQPRCHAPLDDDSETDTMLSDERDNSAEYLRRKKFFTPRESLVSAHGSFRIGPAGNDESHDLLERLNELHVESPPPPPPALLQFPRSRLRRASTNEVIQHSEMSPPAETEMVWEWGQMPREASRPAQTGLKHMLLERIHSDVAPTQRHTVTGSPMMPIPRRRRYDSEPAMSHVTAAPVQVQDTLIASPLSESNTVDSGTSSLSYNALLVSEAVVDDDDEQHDPTVDPNEVSMSLCGGLLENNEVEDKDLFDRKIVTFEEFNRSPKTYVANPLLIVRLGKKYYNWQAASALFFSLIMFDKPIDEDKVDELQQSSLPKPGWFRSWTRTTSTSSNSTPRKTKPEMQTEQQPTSGATFEAEQRIERSMSDPGDLEVATQQQPQQQSGIRSRTSSMMRSLELSSNELKKLNLNYGENEICFWVTTMYQGTSRVSASIYKWKESDKVVISDIDGTITKSDMMGYIFPTIGKDWTQEGVTKLYNRVNYNGYKFMYLSSRAIGQSSMTKNYLDSVRQNGLSLPRGPVMLNPTSLFMAFHKEVIAREPEKFKISCLQGIKNIFPGSSKTNPFWAGFGNRHTDVKSYREVGIDQEHIFVINHLGQLKQQGKIKNFTISYPELEERCDHFFPSLSVTALLPHTRIYSANSYWSPDLPDIDFDEVL